MEDIADNPSLTIKGGGLDMVEGEDVDEVAKDDEGEVAPLEWHPPPGMGRTEEERGLKRPRVSL